MSIRRYPVGPAPVDPGQWPELGPDAPVIAVSGYAVDAQWGAWTGRTVLLPEGYVTAIRAAGGVPLVLPAVADAVGRCIDIVDGLLIAGGPDLDPTSYGQEPHPLAQPPVPERDASESAAIVAARKRGVPILGICRGMQLLNVTAGGTLEQHLPDVVGHEDHASLHGDTMQTHSVRVGVAGQLARILGPDTDHDVPTYHHQGIARVGAGLIPTAWAPDGTVEAIESDDPEVGFCIGVQWHPEAGVDLRLFTALVTAATVFRRG